MKSQVLSQFVLLAALALVVPLAIADRNSFHPRLENFDRQQQRAAAAAGPARRIKKNEVTHLQQQLPNARVDFDEITEAPKFIRAPGGFLTGPGEMGRAVPPAAHAGLAANDRHQVTKTFVNEHRGLFGHGSEALSAARLEREFVTPH